MELNIGWCIREKNIIEMVWAYIKRGKFSISATGEVGRPEGHND